MKPSINEKLNDVLGLESSSSTEVTVNKPAEIVSSGNPDRDMEIDFNVSRSTIHHLIEKGNELVDNANFFAAEKQDARSIEAAAMAQDTTRENALALFTLHKLKKDIERTTGTNVNGDMNVTQNAVFIGSTGELLRQMKELNADGLLKDALRNVDVIDVQAETINTEEDK